MGINAIQKKVCKFTFGDKNNTIRIEVSDEGQGINLDLHPMIQKNLSAVEEGLSLLMVYQMKYILIEIG